MNRLQKITSQHGFVLLLFQGLGLGGGLGGGLGLGLSLGGGLLLGLMGGLLLASPGLGARLIPCCCKDGGLMTCLDGSLPRGGASRTRARWGEPRRDPAVLRGHATVGAQTPLTFPLTFALALTLLYWGRPAGYGFNYLEVVVAVVVWPTLLRWQKPVFLAAVAGRNGVALVGARPDPAWGGNGHAHASKRYLSLGNLAGTAAQLAPAVARHGPYNTLRRGAGTVATIHP